MSIERGPSPEEMKSENKENEIRIGGGDPIRFSSYKEVLESQDFSGKSVFKQQEIPDEQLDEIREALAGLPFRLGSKEDPIGTIPRDMHNAEVNIGPLATSYDAPENEKNKKVLGLKFGKQDIPPMVSLDTRDASVGLDLHPETGPRNIIRFTPEKPLSLGGREIGEIAIVIPFEVPEKKSQ